MPRHSQQPLDRRAGAGVAVVVVVALASAAPAAAGCDRTRCGPGTDDVGGVCVPAAVCGPGTSSDGGVCWAEETCGEGTFEVDGECVPAPPSAIEVDVPETAEPNDPLAGGPDAPFLLPALGEEAVLLGGTVGSPEDSPGGEGDLDGFVFQGDAGTGVRFTGLSRGASSVAFLLRGADAGANDAFERWGYQGGGGHARRDVVLPVTGTYRLIVSEAANVLRLRTGEGWPAGGPEDRYAVAVETFTLPLATDVAPPFVADGFFADGMLPVFAVDAAAGTTLHVASATPDPELVPAALVFVEATFELLVPVAGTIDAIVPLDDRVLVVQDFVFGDGVAQGFTLTLE